MQALLFLVLLAADDNANAISRFEEGKKLLLQDRFDDAIEAFDAALRSVPDEAESLKYRDQGVVVRSPYYPYYHSGLARLSQASRSDGLEVKQQHLEDALKRLGKSIHKDAKPKVREVQSLLAEIEEERGRRMREAVQKREEVLALQMKLFLSSDPLESPADRVRSLKEARVPSLLKDPPPAKFQWLDRFIDLYDKSKNDLQFAASLDDLALLNLVEEFERAAERALEIRFFSGFRAGRHVADKLRLARLNRLASEVVNVSQSWSRAQAIESSSKNAERRWSDALKKYMEQLGQPSSKDEVREYLKTAFPAQRSRIEEIIKLMPRPEQETQVVRAELLLSDPRTVKDSESLGRLAEQLSRLTSEPAYKKLPVSLRARGHLTVAVAKISVSLLEGETIERALESCREAALRAYSLDTAVDRPLREGLSPKILSILDKIKS